MATGRISSFPLGVDLIEIREAKNFYRTHKNHLASLFSDKEIRFIQMSKKPHESLGILLAAKEAAFKALPQKEIGIAGFRGIEILPAANGRLRLKSNEKIRNKKSVEFSVLKNKKLVMVQCAGI